jgi:hypothetical protein
MAGRDDNNREWDRIEEEIRQRDRSLAVREAVEDAYWFLHAGRSGVIPAPQGAWQAYFVLHHAVAVLLQGPVDGWPCEETAA